MTIPQAVLGVEIDRITPDGVQHSTTLAQDNGGFRLIKRRDNEVLQDLPISALAARAWLLAYRRRLSRNLLKAA